MRTRNGKIARLPRTVRDELNERLECSEPSPTLLAWLNARPEVRKMVKQDFEGVPISRQNLSQWRRGGFEEWRARGDLIEGVDEVVELADEVGGRMDGVAVDAAAVLLAARFGNFIANWNGQVTRQFEAQTEIMARLSRSVVPLQRSMHRACREALETKRIEHEMELQEIKETKSKLLRRLFHSGTHGMVAKMFGGGPAGSKVADYFQAIQQGEFDAELDLQPEDMFDSDIKKQKKAAKEAAEKAAAESAAKSSGENETPAAPPESPAPSQSVKPCNTEMPGN